MSEKRSTDDSFALASRFLHALQAVNKKLSVGNIIGGHGHLNLSQLRILQLAHDDPGILADVVIESLDLAPDTAKKLILAMEKTGLMTLDRSTEGKPLGLRLGAQGQRLSFQVQATQLVTVAKLLGSLPKTDQLAAVEALEQVAIQELE